MKTRITFTRKTILHRYILLIVTFIHINLFAQVSIGGSPYSFNYRVGNIVSKVQMPPVDVPALLAEDAIEETKGLPFRFGFPHQVDLNLNNSGTWESLPDGSRLWRLNIYSPGATTINLIYSDFWLPKNSEFFIYNENKSEVIGAFTYLNNNEDGQFATGLIRGESIILEYHEGAQVDNPGIISISSVVHGYKNIFGKFTGEGFGSSGSCNNNVNCPEGAPWQNEKRAAAMILTSGGSRLCSGSLVNNVRQDLTPYFLTANHCWSSSSSTWIIMFKYESPNCNNIDGPLNYTVAGTTTKARNSASDFALMLLNSSVPDSYQVHYAGWNAIDLASQNSVGIHHPAGDIKKISFDYEPVTSSDYVPSPYLANSHWEVASWNDGTTEPGSSGSPLYDQNHRIVGQLHGGWASCTSITQDYYGKFSMSWNYGSTPATRLKDWLDPDNTGTLTLDGWDPTIGTPDTVAPTQIIDLAAGQATSNSLTLTWTAPLDTSYGGVKSYDIRHASVPITDTITFNAATPISYPGIPGSAGSPQNLIVNNLNINTSYYFAIRSKDNWNNWSHVSNSPLGTTLGTPKIDTDPDSLHEYLSPNSIVVDSIIISNISINASTLDYSIELANNTFPSDKVKISLVPVNQNIGEKTADDKDDPQLIFGQSIEGQGGPDAFGYKWIDSDEPNGPTYVWNDISSTGTLVSAWTATGTYDAKDEGIAGPFPLGFNFKFYGNTKTQVYINTNGIILFGTVTQNIFTNATIPDSPTPNDFIAPFWDDLDGRTQGSVHYKQDGNKFIIQFTNWQKYSATGSLTFQIVLHSNGKIMVYYNNMNATLNSATIGIENAAGTVGLQVVNDANYVKNNLALLFAAEPDWLSNNILGGNLYNGNSVAVMLTFQSDDYPLGDYSMDLVVTSNDPTSPTLTVPIKMTIKTPVQLNLTALIEGFFNGTTMISDTVIVELHNASSPFSLLESKKVPLNSAGQGSGVFNSAVETTSYYIVVKHRNSIETWSKIPQQFNGGTLSYDFTTSASQAFGDNLVLKGSKYCIYSGDVNQDGIVDLSDLILVDNDNANFIIGYVPSDVNGDNNSDLSDMIIVDNNNAAFVGKVIPPGAVTAKKIRLQNQETDTDQK